MNKNNPLNELARNMVGDGQSPNMFFVSEGSEVKMVTYNAAQAHAFWSSLSQNKETMLEDRKTGVISDTSPREDGSTELVTHDDYFRFKKAGEL